MESTLNGNGKSEKISSPGRSVACGTNVTTYQALADLRRRMRLFANFSERASRSAGLSTLEYQGLLAIKVLSPQGATRHALCRELDLKWASTEALAKRLEQSRFVRVEADAQDRRFKRLRLTARGESVLQHLAAKHLATIRAGFANVIGSLNTISGRDEEPEDAVTLRAPRVADSR